MSEKEPFQVYFSEVTSEEALPQFLVSKPKKKFTNGESNMVDLVVVGSYAQDLAFVTEQFPEPGETRIGDFRTGPGGKGFNKAVAAHRQQISAMFIGAIGTDFCKHPANAIVSIPLLLN